MRIAGVKERYMHVFVEGEDVVTVDLFDVAKEAASSTISEITGLATEGKFELRITNEG